MIWLILLYFNMNWSNNSRHIFSVYSSRNFFLWITIKLSLFNCEWISGKKIFLLLLLFLVWIQSFLVVVVVVIVIILKRKNGFFLPWFFSATGLCFPILFARSSSSLLASLTTRTTTTTIPNGIFTNRNHQLYSSVLSFFSGWTHNDRLLFVVVVEMWIFIHSFIQKQTTEWIAE